MHRRKFFRICAAGMAAAAVPTFLRPEKIQGKIIMPDLPVYSPKDTESLSTSWLWNIQESREYTDEEIALALEFPLRKSVLSGDITSKIFETVELEGTHTIKFPLNYGRIPDRIIYGERVKVPLYKIDEEPAIEEICKMRGIKIA